LKVDFRLIARPIANWRIQVREKEFRSDLYYRLNVFPIECLRCGSGEEDIPVLVEHFVRKFARR